MPQPQTTRTEDSPQALALTQAAHNLSPAAASLGGDFLRTLSRLNTVENVFGLTGVVVKDDAEHKLLTESLYSLKEYRRAVDRFYEPTNEERARTKEARTIKSMLTRLGNILAGGSVVYRREQQEQEQARARAKAETERKRVLAQQEKEAEALEAAAKKKRGADAKVLRDQAKSVRKEEVQTVDEAVDAHMEDVARSQRGLGRGAMVDHWSAEVVDLGKIPRKYLVADLVALNKVARDRKSEDLGILGVVGVNKPGIARS